MNDQNRNDENNIPQNGITDDASQPEIRFFTLKELEQYNGRDGMPAYVAMDGVVYNVTKSLLWDDGDHFGMLAGKDLTVRYKTCHVGRPRIGRFPVVGYIKENDDTNTDG